ncbi:hypothetical protein C8R45DRAFT_1024058 [Mycena sanguinolenta]|nr:hypothetical protein C8R45DRAFT_1024058 [Mycena sanguinolenta]
MQSNQYSSYLRVGAVSVNDEYSKVLTNALVRVVVSRSHKFNEIASPPVHPILSLPPELISLIFIHCLPPYAELRSSKAPLLLTRICGAWRTLALRTPALWASVSFKIFHDASIPTGHELKFRKLTWWLAQGAAHPLTLNLHCHTQHPALVPLLLAHAARWADADIFLHPSTLTAFSDAAESESGSSALELPLLRRLSLGCWPLRFKADANSERTLPIITAFANAPRLTHVSLLKLPLSAVVLPWAQLTNLFASCAGVNDVARVLRLAPALQRLQLDFRDWPAPEHEQTSDESEDVEVESFDVVHKSLTSLTLHTHPALVVPLSLLLGAALPPLSLPSPSPLAGMTSGVQLTLPSLTSLSLPPLAPTDVSTFIAFAARSRLGDTLRELTLPITPLARGVILSVLGPLKSLAKLELRFPGEVVLEDILCALGPVVTPDAAMECSTDDADVDADGDNGKLDPAHIPFLPCLRELHADCFRGRVPYALLRAALEARWRVTADASKPQEPCSSSSASSDQDRACVDVPAVTAQLRSFTVTTLSPSPKPSTPSGSSYFSFWLSSSSLPEEPRVPLDADADTVHIAALQALKAQGMDVNVAYVYGGRVV